MSLQSPKVVALQNRHITENTTMTDLQVRNGELAPPPPLQPVQMSQRGDYHNQGGSASDSSAPLAPVPLRGVPMMQQHHHANVMMPRYDGGEQQQDPNDNNMDKQQHFMPYGCGGGPPYIMGAPSFPPPMGAEMPTLGGGIKGGADSAGISEQDPNNPSSHHHHMMMHHYGPPPPGAEEMEHAPHMMYGGGGEYYHSLAYSASAEENMPHGPPPGAGAPGGWYPPPPHYNPHHGGPSPTMMGMPGPPHGLPPPPLPPSEYYGHHHPHSLPPPPPPPHTSMMMMYDQQGPPSVDGSFSLGGALPPPQPPTDEEATADGSLPSLLTAPSGGTNLEGAYSHHQYNPPPAGIPSGLQKDTYIQDPDSYITSNLAIAEQYRRVNPEVHIGFRPRKATTAKAGGTLSKRQLQEGARKRKVKSCTVKGCPRQSRGIRFNYMCQRHWNESKGIVSNFVDWRMLLQPDENNPGKKAEDNGNVNGNADKEKKGEDEEEVKENEEN